jgi:UDP-N-acetylglucosamine pyrophosphorylase
MQQQGFRAFERKMRDAGVNDAAIRAFQNSYELAAGGATGTLPESSIQPVTELPALDQINGRCASPEVLGQTVVIKLNGGLGTSMGLERAKSLLEVKPGLTFLDFIARQLCHLRRQSAGRIRFLLMNSFSTSADTLDYLGRYPELGDPAQLELLQSQVPKVDARTLQPVECPGSPQLEWCPPGHGDIYPSLLGSGKLRQLLDSGVRYAFVSNSDNLGASLHPGLLEWFTASGKPFVMEVCQRTSSDRKGGHLARGDRRFVLREAAQCPDCDWEAFQDITRHRFFNTNNLWIRLDAIEELLERSGGFVPLPLIRNAKTADPRDKNSTPVLQLETAMGAAIGCFDNSGAVVVPRTRFAPVKTTGDLLALRSDAYRVTSDERLQLETPSGTPPSIDLDAAHYTMVDQFERHFPQGAPSLRDCTRLTVRGPVTFGAPVVLRGEVQATAAQPAVLAAGTYENQDVRL